MPWPAPSAITPALCGCCDLFGAGRIPTHLETGSRMTVPTPYLPAIEGDAVIIADPDDLDPESQAWHAANLPGVGAEMLFPIVCDDAVVGVVGLLASQPRS